MSITKEQIKEWLLSRSTPEDEILPLMVDVIHDCAKDLSPKWASAYDELPKYGEPVILKINGTVQHVTYMSDRYDEGPDWFERYHYNDADSAVDIDGKVELEWMPLPELPK